MTVRSLFRYPLGNQRPSGRRAVWLVIKKRKCSTKKRHHSVSFFVELEGIEPSSKRGNNTLSTCLSLPLIFVRRQDQGHQPIGLSSKILFALRSQRKPVSIYPHLRFKQPRNNGVWEMSCLSTLCQDKANLLLFDQAARA